MNRLDFGALFYREINDVELALLAETPLGRRQIHQSEVAAEHPRRPLFLEQRANRVILLASRGRQGNLRAYGKMEPARERLGQRNGVRLRDEIQRLVESEAGACELMVPNGEIGEQIHSVYVESLTSLAAHRQESLDGRGCVLNAGRIANDRKERFVDAAFSIGNLQYRFTGDLLDGRLKRTGERSIDHRDGDDNGDAERNAKECQRRSQLMASHMPPGQGLQQPEHQQPSFSTLPSRKKILRSPWHAASRLWVTITTVQPSSRLIWRRSAKTDSPVLESRLPVGSSANKIGGLNASARAMAMR